MENIVMKILMNICMVNYYRDKCAWKSILCMLHVKFIKFNFQEKISAIPTTNPTTIADPKSQIGDL